MKRAIIYYSLAGHTKKEVETRYQGDFYKLKGKIKIPKNIWIQYLYLGFFSVFSIPLNYEELKIDYTEYDEIVLASPVWAFTIVPFMKKFLKEYPFQGKKVRLMIVHEGGPGRALKHYEKYIRNNKIIERLSIQRGNRYEKDDK